MLQNVLSAWLERNVALGQTEVCVKTKTQETTGDQSVLKELYGFEIEPTI